MEKVANPKDEALESTPKAIPSFRWVPFAAAICLMLLGISLLKQITELKSQLAAACADANRLRQSNALVGLRLEMLDAKDPAYASSKVIVAWDPYRHQGVVSLENLPPPPVGHDYQLWVLDPGALAPLNAGLLTESRSFSVPAVSTPTPGFAISLETSGGQPELTGSILFAVAPTP